MRTNDILQADVIDIIFEHRNKKYGAYPLRKFYKNRLYKAMVLTFLFAGILLMLSSLKKDHRVMLETEPYIFMKSPSAPEKPEKPKDPKQPQKPVKAQPKAAMQKAPGAVVIAPDNSTDKIPDINNDVPAGNENIDGKKAGPAIIDRPAGGTGETPAPAPVPASLPVDKFTPSNTAEVMPAYPGGMEALRNFLQKNLSNPQDIEEGQTVSVKIRFIVGYDGRLKGFETLEDGGQAFNNEVIRVLKKMPQWIPGKTRGENVSVYYTIPVKFAQDE